MKNKRRLPLTRQQGIVTSKASSDKISYAEVTSKLKDGMQEAFGVKYTVMRHTKGGAISMTVGKSSRQSAEKLKVAVEAVLGADAGIRIPFNTMS